MTELGAHGVSTREVVAVARHGAPVGLVGRRRGTRWPRRRRSSSGSPQSDEPAYGVSTGFGSLAQTRIPAERRAELQRALIRSHAAGMGDAGRARGRAGDDAACAPASLAMGRSGARPVLAETIAGAAQRRAHPVVPEHGSLGASGDLAPLAHCALALIGEGEVVRRGRRARPGGRGARRGRHRAARPRRQGGPGADQRHRRHPRHARPRPRRPRRPAAGWPTSPRRCQYRGAARHRPRLRRRPARAAPAARPGGQRRQPAPPARPARRSSPATARATRASRTPTRCAARRRSTAPRATPSPTPSAVAEAELGRRDRQPDGPARRPGRVVRQLPRRAARPSPATSSPSPSPRSARSPSAAPTACSTPPAPTACRRSSPPDAGRRLRADDRPVHAGGDGRREPPARRPGQRRLAADQRHAGGPRLDGLGGGAQAAPVGRQPASDPRGRARLRRPRPRPAGPARARRAGTGAALAALRERSSPARARTAGWPRSCAAVEALLRSRRRCWPRSRRQVGELRMSGPRARCARRTAPSSPAAAGRRRRRCGC